jgi:Zn-dependent protease with chaperone function
MFSALCIAACLAVLVLASAGGTVLSGAASFFYLKQTRAHTADVANKIFFLRMLPLAAGIAASLGLALPAFLLLEPLATGEAVSIHLLVLAALGLVMLGGLVFRLVASLRATRNQAGVWMENSRAHHLANMPKIYVVPEPIALLAVVGIFKPRLFISVDVLQSLQPEELSAAVQHELAHMDSFDNLKHLAMKVTQPPRWIVKSLALDRVWLNASEVAADNGALRQGTSALDLASALVKVAKISSRTVLPAAVTASHLIPNGTAAELPTRIMHLRQCVEQHPSQPLQANSAQWMIIPALGMAAYVAILLFGLPIVHDLIEALVR